MAGRFGGIPIDMGEISSGGEKKSGVGRFGGIPLEGFSAEEVTQQPEPTVPEQPQTRLLDQPTVEQPVQAETPQEVEDALRIGGATEEDISPQPIQEPQQRDVSEMTLSEIEDAVGFGKSGVLRNLVSAIAGGTAGTIGGAIEGIAKGGIGTPEGARQTQETAQKRATQATEFLAGGEPSEAAQFALETLAEVTEPLQALPPAVQAVGRGQTSRRRIREGLTEEPIGALVPPSIDENIVSVSNMFNKDRKAILGQIGDTPRTRLQENTRKGLLAANTSRKMNQRIKLAKKHNISEGTAGAFAGSTKGDKRAMREMVTEAKTINIDDVFSVDHNHTRDLGNTILERYKAVEHANKRAGVRLESVAERNLAGRRIDASEIRNAFAKDVEKLGGYMTEEGTLAFTELAPRGKPRALMSEVWRFLNAADDDAFALHQAKRSIDEAVTYGKPGEGLSGNAERIAKGVRAAIDKKLDDAFDEYNRVNTQYSETIQSMNEFKDVAGPLFHADEAISADLLGLLGRELVNKDAKSTILRQSLKKLENTAGKYGVKFKNDIDTQALFNAELEKAFKMKYETLDEELLRIAPLETARGARGDWKSSVADVLTRVFRRSVSDSADTKTIDALERLIQEER